MIDFHATFKALTGNPPFPWQHALFERFVAGEFPETCDLPTGLGKTSVIVIWLLAVASNPTLPRRLVYVVNRRTVVDQATAEAERVRERLVAPELATARAALDAMSAVTTESPIAISTLRGQFADNGAWRRDPSRPAIVIGTVDMVGSRLLFSGYGCGFRSRPLHAGLLGQDAILVHDEAHLEPAFQSLLTSIASEQRKCREPRPLRVMALSATARTAADFTLDAEDLQHAVVRARLHASKTLHVHQVADRKELPEQAAQRAMQLEGKVIVFLSAVEHVERCAQLLRKHARDRVVTLTGTMRGAERDELVRNPIFARFLPWPSADVEPKDGTVFLVATSAGEVGIDISADHLVSDLPPFDALAQRLGRVNRFGDGSADVHVLIEPLKAPPAQDTTEQGGEDGEAATVTGRDDYERSRARTALLLDQLPLRDEGGRDCSPSALRGLSLEARLAASTPAPVIPPVDDLLFDRWAFTSIRGALPGRPAVAEWLHGRAEWEPPRTTVAWRREVSWLSDAHLGSEGLDGLLDDYPLRSRETLTDVTGRVLKHLQRLAERDTSDARAWLIRPDVPAAIMTLRELVDAYDAKRNPTLDNATVVLPPGVGGLASGLLDGDAEYAEDIPYDVGPRHGERTVIESDDAPVPPGMRLVRAINRSLSDEDEAQWWRLYAEPYRADDDGSRTSRRPLLLDSHLRRTGEVMEQVAVRLGLGDQEHRALVAAARGHDLGKRRSVWQRAIKCTGDPPLAKGPMQPSELGHFRHEFGSLLDVELSRLTEDERELALHAIAAHHGRGRPHFPVIEAFDPEATDDVARACASDVPLRFDRLQRRYGRWGLAWLESLLRAADAIASADEGEVA